LLRFLEQTAVGEVVGIASVEADELEARYVTGTTDVEIDSLAAIECVIAKHVIDALRRAGEGGVGARDVTGNL
jgi:hypothetical protein